jgi:hypothetical protein
MTVSIQEKIIALAKGNPRSTQLLASFSGGFADGWAMAVKECFRNQLDIKYTARIENRSTASGPTIKRQVKAWTQGPRIAFDTGNVFYDTPLAYEKWDRAMQHIKRACVVLEATPNEIRKKKTGNTKKNINELIDGYVVIELFVPNRGKTKLISQSKFKLSQNQFLEFLITGKLNWAGKLQHPAEQKGGG